MAQVGFGHVGVALVPCCGCRPPVGECYLGKKGGVKGKGGVFVLFLLLLLFVCLFVCFLRGEE